MIYNQVVDAKTAGEAWDKWFELLKADAEASEIQSSRDGDVVAEVINAVTIIHDPTRGIVTSKTRNMPMRYAIGELLWYLSKNRSLKAIQNYTSAWDRMSDDGEFVNSNYGHRIHEHFNFDQWDYVKEKLLRNPNDRQCVIHIKDGWEHGPTKDTPCTIAIQYIVRDGALHATTFMRSNDLWMGFPYDVFCFTAFQVLMAFELGLNVGTYTHYATSLHIYKRDFDKVGRKENEA